MVMVPWMTMSDGTVDDDAGWHSIDIDIMMYAPLHTLTQHHTSF